MQRWIVGLGVMMGATGCLTTGGGGASPDVITVDGGATVDGQVSPDGAQALPDAAPPAPVDAGTMPPAPDAAPPAPDADVPPAPDAAVPPPLPDGVDACGDIRVAAKVYNGTVDPTHVSLTPGQILAIGSFDGCSGTLITPTWVLTATHCGLRAGANFCVGEDPARPNRCQRAVRVVDNPQADQSLVELAGPLDQVAPGAEPFAIMDQPMDRSWIGRTAEAAGYGQTERGQFNVRWFTAEPISAVGQPYLTIDGQGERGVCFGDSGGPVFVIADDGTVRVAGDLSHGDPSCLGQDNYTRTDLFADWIEGITGPTGPVGGGSPMPCGEVDAVGRCDGSIATWCDGDVLAREGCDSCGWSDRAGGFRCLQGADPCGGFDREGACDGQVARWCDNGIARARDCGSCGLSCTVQMGVGANCIDDPCVDLDYLGRCTGDTAEWCDDEGFHSTDCSEQGASCGYIDRRVGYYCQ